LTQCLSTTNRRREFIADPESVDFPIFFIHFDMQKLDRRQFLRNSASAVGSVAMLGALPASIQRALAIPAHNKSGTIDDIEHIVVLMQENRSFDHYFGTLRGVRGYGDRFPIPLASGKSVWYQSDGTKEITPFRFDKNTMNAALIPDMPHNFPDAQAAWNQGSYGYWPKYKSATSMGYYTREEAPFQYALAEAFTICDAYHCSVTTGTDPNRIAFFSGSNNNPALRNQGINCTDADAEPVNLRCWITGTWPTPGYTYAGSGFNWPTLPDVLESAGISWRIYQDPNNNWTGAMNGCLAFNSFRNAKPGSPIYEKGMSNWSLDDLANDVRNGTLPSVSWVLPSQLESEHPGAPSSAAHGGYFVEQVLQALTSNPDTWSKTAFLLTFDENDGLFDHVPPPAVPSYNPDGSLAGKSTMDVNGMYFAVNKPSYLLAADTASGNIRPWGMGARVPMYVVSPWSKGGFVNSQVFDHASLGLFLEKRFNVTIPAISKWRRPDIGVRLLASERCKVSVNARHERLGANRSPVQGIANRDSPGDASRALSGARYALFPRLALRAAYQCGGSTERGGDAHVPEHWVARRSVSCLRQESSRPNPASLHCRSRHGAVGRLLEPDGDGQWSLRSLGLRPERICSHLQGQCESRGCRDRGSL
jgi:phospholipase C